jgi:hypothetical protein
VKKVYRGIAVLIALGVVLQAAAIAFAWFKVLGDLDGGAVITSDYEGNAGHAMHGIVGMTVIPLLALLLMATSPFAKVRGASKWAGLVLLAVVAQVVLAFVSFGVAAVGALHGMNALVVLGLALMTARRVGTADGAHAGSAGSAQVPQQAAAPQQSSTV